MRRFLLSTSFIFTFLLLAVVPAYADDIKILKTVELYTQALKSGDVEEIKNLLGGRLYEKRRVLLEENTEYSDWLKQYYAGASFSFPTGVTSSSDQFPGKQVDVELHLGNVETVTTHLLLQSPTGSDQWKIVGQLR